MIDETAAGQLLRSVLHRDLAYGAEAMPEALAAVLAIGPERSGCLWVEDED